MRPNTDDEIRHIHKQWHEMVASRNLDGLMALYAEDAILETPLILVTLRNKTEGVLKGKTEIEAFFRIVLSTSQGELSRWYRKGTFFSDGQCLIWEYPRETPHGDQVDLIEVMDMQNGLVAYHRVYWGWVGFKALVACLEMV
jgi:steroid delta-isomerase